MYINVNSFRNKFIDLLPMLQEGFVDVLIVGESKLDCTFTNSQFSIDNFSLYRKDRNCHGGGVLAYVNNSIAHCVRHDFDAFIFNGLEGIVIEINMYKKRWLLSGLYKPPSISDNLFQDTFCKLLDSALSVTTNTIVVGDLNYNMNNDNILKNICDIYGLKNKISGNTCFKQDNATAIDVFLVSDSRHFGCGFNADISTSDFHNIIGCVLKLEKPISEKKVIYYRSFKNFDTQKFHDDLKRAPFNSYLQQDCVDDQMSSFYTMFTHIVDKHLPLKRKTINKSPAPFMNGELRRAIYVKCMLRNRYYKHRSGENWNRYRKQRNLVTKLRRKSIRTYFQLKCEGTNNKNTFWQTIKPFISNKHKGSGDNIILREGSDIITNQSDVCNVFNDYFANVASGIGFDDQIPSNIPKNMLMETIRKIHYNHPSVNLIMNNVKNKHFEFKYTNENCVLKILNNLNIKKATGYDTLSPKIIKLSAKHIASFITQLINKCINDSTFPSKLKNAEISSIHKKKDKLNKENYRPVSILVVLSKVFERIYTEQIEHYFAEIFSSLLSAYRKGYGTCDVLLKFTDEWKHALDNNMFSCALLMDLSKAFDCMPHSLLVAKLHAYGFTEKACLLMASYLSHRKQRVKLGNMRSQWSNITKGIPQGSILGPVLFNVFINDLYYSINVCKLYNYADDNTLFYSSINLNDVLAVIKYDAEVAVNWFNKNGMRANPEKFQLILSHRRYKQEVTINVCGVHLQSTTNVKLLGVTFDNDLYFNSQINDVCKQAGRQLSVLQRFSNVLSEKNKMLIFQSFILSQLRYCPLIWHFSKKGKMKTMEKIQERALRFVFKDSHSTYQELLLKGERQSLFRERQKLFCVQVYKILNHLSPSYLNELLELKDNIYLYRDPYLIVQPKVNTVKHGILSFRYHAAKLWNNLPPTIKAAATLKEFKHLIRLWDGIFCSCSFCINNV